MKRYTNGLAAVIALLTALTTQVGPANAATCYGYADCRACKNCKYCGHCAKRGGTCGVCAGHSHAEPAAAKPAAKTRSVKRASTKAVPRKVSRLTDGAVVRRPAAAPRPTSGVIDSQIDGDFEGWEGETVFKLTNGQIWQQAEYSYTYSYPYMPDVLIYPTSDGWRMKVEGEEETIRVRRLR